MTKLTEAVAKRKIIELESIIKKKDNTITEYSLLTTRMLESLQTANENQEKLLKILRHRMKFNKFMVWFNVVFCGVVTGYILSEILTNLF